MSIGAFAQTLTTKMNTTIILGEDLGRLVLT